MTKIINQRGFTLVELMIGMVIVTILMAAIFAIFSVSLKSQQHGFSHERVYNEGRSLINVISDELRYSTVSTPGAADLNAYTGINFTKNGQNRSFSFNTSSIILNNGTTTTTYAQQMVQSISFQRDNASPNLVHVSLNLSYNYQGISKTMDFSAAIMTGTKF